MSLQAASDMVLPLGGGFSGPDLAFCTSWSCCLFCGHPYRSAFAFCISFLWGHWIISHLARLMSFDILPSFWNNLLFACNIMSLKELPAFWVIFSPCMSSYLPVIRLYQCLWPWSPFCVYSVVLSSQSWIFAAHGLSPKLPSPFLFSTNCSLLESGLRKPSV